MGIDSKAVPAAGSPQGQRTREGVLHDIKVALAKERNYGREARSRGSNPYESSLGVPQQRDIWGSRRRPA